MWVLLILSRAKSHGLKISTCLRCSGILLFGIGSSEKDGFFRKVGRGTETSCCLQRILTWLQVSKFKSRRAAERSLGAGSREKKHTSRSLLLYAARTSCLKTEALGFSCRRHNLCQAALCLQHAGALKCSARSVDHGRIAVWRS